VQSVSSSTLITLHWSTETFTAELTCGDCRQLENALNMLLATARITSCSNSVSRDAMPAWAQHAGSWYRGKPSLPSLHSSNIALTEFDVGGSVESRNQPVTASPGRLEALVFTWALSSLASNNECKPYWWNHNIKIAQCSCTVERQDTWGEQRKHCAVLVHVVLYGAIYLGLHGWCQLWTCLVAITASYAGGRTTR